MRLAWLGVKEPCTKGENGARTIEGVGEDAALRAPGASPKAAGVSLELPPSVLDLHLSFVNLRFLAIIGIVATLRRKSLDYAVCFFIHPDANVLLFTQFRYDPPGGGIV